MLLNTSGANIPHYSFKPHFFKHNTLFTKHLGLWISCDLDGTKPCTPKGFRCLEIAHKLLGQHFFPVLFKILWNASFLFTTFQQPPVDDSSLLDPCLSRSLWADEKSQGAQSQQSQAGERSSGAVMIWSKIMHMLTASKKTPGVGSEDKRHRWSKGTAGLSTLTMMT